jgi:putative DNA primase/helicase
MIEGLIYHDLVMQAQAIVRALGGTPSGEGGLCRCPAHDDERPSLSVRPGRRALLFKCFAGCDTLDVLKALRVHGVAHRDGPDPAGATRPQADARRTNLAQRLWNEGRPLRSDQAARYLARRGLTGAPSALKFHPRTPLGRGTLAIRRPALLVGVTDDDGLTAFQRCFLDARHSTLARDLIDPRRMLGSPGAGAARLAAAAHRLGLAEGLETALSAMALLNIPVWARLGAERFGRVAIPDDVAELILLPDNDRAGRLGEARARAAYERPGRNIVTVWPSARFNDWNDVLQAGGRRAGDGCGSAV